MTILSGFHCTWNPRKNAPLSSEELLCKTTQIAWKRRTLIPGLFPIEMETLRIKTNNSDGITTGELSLTEKRMTVLNKTHMPCGTYSDQGECFATFILSLTRLVWVVFITDSKKNLFVKWLSLLESRSLPHTTVYKRKSFFFFIKDWKLWWEIIFCRVCQGFRISEARWSIRVTFDHLWNE